MKGNVLLGQLEPGDRYIDHTVRVRLPHDADAKDPERLAALSGPCVTVVAAREVDDDGKTEESVTDA